LPPEALDSAVGRIELAESNYHTFFDSLMTADPGFDLFFRGGGFSLQGLSEKLGHNSALLYYFSIPEVLYCWAVTSEGTKALQLPITDSLLREKVELFRGQIRSLSEVETSAKELYALLIKPLELEIASKKRLCILPWGSLYYLPFGLLIDEGGEYLTQRWELFYLPSCSYLFVEPLSPEDYKQRMTYLADPKPNPLGVDESWGLSLTFGDDALSRISGLDELETAPPPGRFLHLALSGKLNPKRPFDSGFNSGDADLSFLDFAGFPRQNDLLSWLNVEIPPVLGSEGLEMELLWRLLLSFRCQRALLAQWAPELLARAILLKRFYRSVLRGEEIPAALILAQRKIQETYNPHPNFWGGYYLLGEP
jgi:hypothetical protein